jgi:hypothetical protein
VPALNLENAAKEAEAAKANHHDQNCELRIHHRVSAEGAGARPILADGRQWRVEVVMVLARWGGAYSRAGSSGASPPRFPDVERHPCREGERPRESQSRPLYEPARAILGFSQ